MTLLGVAKDPVAGATAPIPIRVEFEAPAGCSDVEAFYAGVLSRSDRARRAGAGEDGLRLGVRLTRAGGKVHGELRVLDGRGETDTRKMEGVRCDEVVEVLSLTAALAIDPAARLAPARPPAKGPAAPPAPVATESLPPAEPPPPPPEPPPPPVTVTSPPDRDAGPPRTFGLGLGASTFGAQIIAPAINLGGAISLRLARFNGDAPGPSLTVAGLYLSNDLVQSATEVAITLVGASVTACPGWTAGRTIVIEPCAHAIGGRVTGTGRGLTNPDSVNRSWWSVGALARASIMLGAGFSLELEAGFGVPLTQRRFESTTPERTVGESTAISGLAGIGVSRRM
jgi:hypothetical protein